MNDPVSISSLDFLDSYAAVILYHRLYSFDVVPDPDMLHGVVTRLVQSVMTSPQVGKNVVDLALVQCLRPIDVIQQGDGLLGWLTGLVQVDDQSALGLHFTAPAQKQCRLQGKGGACYKKC